MNDIFITHFKMTCIAFIIDLLIGDPRWFPHPVRGMGWLNQQFEAFYRKKIINEYYAGALAALSILICCGSLAFLILLAALLLGESFYLITGAILIYFTIAARDLMSHALRIVKPLKRGDLSEARKQLSMIVGRDTENLNENEISRATVESVAENTVDGVTSPLFYALIFGPIGAVIYRGINTMDSMYAYKNERYIKFGRIPAFLDDFANFLPARITGVFICLAAFFNGSPVQAWKIMRRDGQKHPSPNSGITEAAVAGALKVQLGGPSTYNGVLSNKSTLGDPILNLSLRHITKSILMMYLASVGFIFSAALFVFI